MLDTNAASEVIKAPDGAVGRQLTALPGNMVTLSVVALGELLFGFEKNPTPRLRERLFGFLERLQIVPLDDDVAAQYGHIRAQLERAGTPIGQNDMWIGAHALSCDATLVTDNVGEFERIEGLRVQNWLRS
jgi:tRNA(fMet)-specific endonuclease VapC